VITRIFCLTQPASLYPLHTMHLLNRFEFEFGYVYLHKNISHYTIAIEGLECFFWLFSAEPALFWVYADDF